MGEMGEPVLLYPTFAAGLLYTLEIQVRDQHTRWEVKQVKKHTLAANEMPQHTHEAVATSDAADNTAPTGNRFASTPGLYHAPESLVTMDPSNIPNVGGGQAHENMQPYLVVNYCIALQGLFPSRN